MAMLNSCFFFFFERMGKLSQTIQILPDVIRGMGKLSKSSHSHLCSQEEGQSFLQQRALVFLIHIPLEKEKRTKKKKKNGCHLLFAFFFSFGKNKREKAKIERVKSFFMSKVRETKRGFAQQNMLSPMTSQCLAL